jgi:orotate phosphoribosyltransferase
MHAHAGFTEKDGDGMKLARFEIEPGQKVLIVEDVISTGGSTLKTIEGIKKAGVPQSDIWVHIVCLVNRSGRSELDGHEICALLTLDIHNWKAEECPLCKVGSKALRPKANWAELTRV